MEIYVARQPVFTKQKKIFGYELLFRNGLKNAFPDIDGDIATSNLLSHTFFSFELKEILGRKPGLVNFTKDLILQQTPLLFPQDHIIIEVLENIEPDPRIVQSLKQFASRGFRIALDDFVYHEKFTPMINLCKIIKFDIMATPLDTLYRVIADIQNNYKITLLAEKVETHAEFQQAVEMGFTLFQGYFFAKPEILSKRDITPNEMTKIALVNEISRQQIDLTKIESLIKKDVSVSFKLLKFLNSSYFKRREPINTIKDAITFLGENELKKFIMVVAVSDLSEGKPNELTRSALIRARMCEQCGSVVKSNFSCDALFILGLFSCMDAMLDIAMADILETIDFSDEMKTALLGNDKDFKKLLQILTCVERGDWNNHLLSLFSGTRLEKKLPLFYFNALKMADSFIT